MFGKGRGERLKEGTASASVLALALAQDKRFRKRLLSAIAHGTEAGRRTRRGLRLSGAVARLAADQTLLRELKSAQSDLEQAYRRLEAKRRSRKLRNLLLLAALATFASVPQLRDRLLSGFSASSKRFPLRRGAGEPATRPSSGDSKRPSRLDDLTKEELYARAQEADIPGRSEMSKEQLIKALRARS